MDKRAAALARMRELNVEIKEKERFTNFTLLSSKTTADAVEFGFLLAQLNEHEYPEGFASLGSNPYSKVYGKPVKGKLPPVQFVESYPHGLKYRIFKKGYQVREEISTDSSEQIMLEMKEAVGDYFDIWFVSPVPSLGNRTPKEVLALPGGEEDLRRLITAIKNGIPE